MTSLNECYYSCFSYLFHFIFGKQRILFEVIRLKNDCTMYNILCLE